MNFEDGAGVVAGAGFACGGAGAGAFGAAGFFAGGVAACGFGFGFGAGGGSGGAGHGSVWKLRFPFLSGHAKMSAASGSGSSTRSNWNRRSGSKRRPERRGRWARSFSRTGG